MPRRYRMGRRAEQKDVTRARIVQAAANLYMERGVSATTMQEVARVADVAPATVLNHFPSREALDRAIVDLALSEMELPELSLFDGARSMAERIRRLTRATGRFLDQGATWYRMWVREPMIGPHWDEAGSRFGARFNELFRRALGPLADDPDANAMIRATMHPAFFDALREGRTTDEVADLVAAALTPWLERSERSLSK